MAIYRGDSEIPETAGQIQIGNTNVQEVYAGDSLVWSISAGATTFTIGNAGINFSVDLNGNVSLSITTGALEGTNYTDGQVLTKTTYAVTRTLTGSVRVPNIPATWTNAGQLVTITGISDVQEQGLFPPTVTTVDAFSVGATNMSMRGQITADDPDATSYGIQWGTTSALGNTVPATNRAMNGTFSIDQAGLTAQTTYYFRAYAINAAGTGTGAILTQQTTAAALQPADIITDISVSDQGVVTVTTNNRGYVYYIGENATGGNTLTGPATSQSSNIYPLVDGLTSRTPYIGIRVDDASVPNDGVDLSIRTIETVAQQPALPNVTTLSPNTTTTAATLNGAVNSVGAAATSATFYWLIDDTDRDAAYIVANGTAISASGLAGNVTASINYGTSTTDRTLQFILSASNANGTTNGADVSAAIPAIISLPVTNVTTTAATGIGETSATLNGTFTAGANVTVSSASFIWGTSQAEVSAGVNNAGIPIGSGVSSLDSKFDEAAGTADEVLSGLTAGTTYFYQLVVIDAISAKTGGVLSFETDDVVANTISASPSDLTFDAAGGLISFAPQTTTGDAIVTITTTPDAGDWRVGRISQTWINATSSGGNLVVGVDALPGGFNPDRDGIVQVVHQDDNTVVATITVEQAGVI